jgi:hypothetical protein
MADIVFLKMPMEAELELGTIVRLDGQHTKGETPDDLVHELDAYRAQDHVRDGRPIVYSRRGL